MTQPTDKPQIVPPDPTDELAAKIAKLLRGGGNAATFQFVPDGYLTSGASGTSVVTGVLMLLYGFFADYQSGQWAQVTFGQAFGLMLTAIGAIGHGIGRKIDRKLPDPS